MNVDRDSLLPTFQKAELKIFQVATVKLCTVLIRQEFRWTLRMCPVAAVITIDKKRIHLFPSLAQVTTADVGHHGLAQSELDILLCIVFIFVIKPPSV